MGTRYTKLFRLCISAGPILLGLGASAAEYQRPGVNPKYVEYRQRFLDSYAPKGAYPTEDGTQAQIDLGRNLYFDRELGEGLTSCADCHSPAHGFTQPALDDPTKGTAIAVGRIGLPDSPAGRQGTRKAQTTLNSCLTEYLRTNDMFWDLRAANPFVQCIGPIANPDEMSNQTPQQMVQRLTPRYAALTQRAFGSPTLTVDRYQAAMVAFERTIKAIDTPLSRWLGGRDDHGMSGSEIRGARIFRKTCIVCHESPTFSNGLAASTGIEYRFGARDIGLQKTNGNVGSQYKFKTPGLVDVASRPPYTHKGDLATLADVVKHYNAGGYFRYGPKEPFQRDPNIDPLIRPLGLNESQMTDLENCLTYSTVPYDMPNISPPPALVTK